MRAPRRAASAVLALACAASGAARAHEPPIEPEPPRYQSVVKGAPRPATAGEVHLAARQIELAPRRSGDDLLRLVPGLLVSRHGTDGKGVQIFLRGFDAAHGADVEASVAGVPLNEWSNVHGQGYLDLSVIIPETVAAISVEKGSFRLGQGRFATAGSLRFALGVPAAARGIRVGFEAGMWNRQRLLVVAAPRRLPESTFFAAEAVREEGFGPERQSERVAFTGQALLFKKEHRGALEAAVLGQAGRFGEPAPAPAADVADGRLGFFDPPVRGLGGSAARGIALLRYRLDHHHDRVEALAFAGWRHLRLVENFTGALLDARGDTRAQAQEAWSGGVRLGYTRRLARGLVLEAGADWLGETVSQWEDRRDDAGAVYRRGRDLAIQQHAGAILAGLRWAPVRWFRVEAGGRLDGFSVSVRDRARDVAGGGTAALVSPRLAAAFQPLRSLALFVAYGRGLRPPEARAFVAAPTNPASPSEYQGGPVGITAADEVEAGVRWSWHDRVALGAAGFATVVDNEVVFDHVSGTSVALDTTRRLGVDLSLRAAPRPWLDLRADLAYVDARFVGSGNPVPGVPRWLFTAQAALVGWRGLSLSLRATYVAPRPLAFGAVSSDYFLLDLGAGWRWDRVRVDLWLQNLTDARWKEGEFNYASHYERAAPRSQLPQLHFTPGAPFGIRAALTLFL